MTSQPACYHCGLPADARGRYALVREEHTLTFCCPGCLAVASTILDGGLGSYYRYRDASPHWLPTQDRDSDYSRYDREEFQRQFVTGEGSERAAVMNIGGMTCAACAWLIEQHLRQLPGVVSAGVNLARHRLHIVWRPGELPLSRIFQAVEDVGYAPMPYTSGSEEQMLQAEQRLALQRLGVAGIGMMQVGMYTIGLYAGALQGISDLHRDFLRLVSLMISTAVVFYSARPFFTSAWRGLRNRSPGMDLPVSLAIALAYGASCWATFSRSGEVYFDSVAMFTFFLLGSRYLELRARHRHHHISQGLAALQPPFAWRLQGEPPLPTQVPVTLLAAGDHLLVKPGDTIAADGRVLQGRSSVDESTFSGEYLPVAKGAGDPVTAGSINTDGVLTVEVTAVADQTRLALITRLLERAQSIKPRSAQLADRIAVRFVIGVLLCSAGAAAFWLWRQPDQALWVALSVLVVSCPCALSLATPTALTASLSALKSRGILLSRSTLLEDLPRATSVVFDKTGTLTTGRLQQVSMQPHGSLDEAQCQLLAAALERHSSHPIAGAFPPAPDPLPLERVEILAGRGVTGWSGGTRYAIGSGSLIEALLGAALPAEPPSHHVRVYLASEHELLATFTLSDAIRPSAAAAVDALRRQGFTVRMLTGDSSGAAAAVARELRIDDYRQGQSADQKMTALLAWQQRGERVVMVGDGVNDVPVLAAADMSIAVVNATELAKATADCLLLSSDLTLLDTTVAVARRTRRVIAENLGWALAYNLTAIPLAACALIPPWLAAIGMSASSLVVVANALRLYRVPPGHHASHAALPAG